MPNIVWVAFLSCTEVNSTGERCTNTSFYKPFTCKTERIDTNLFDCFLVETAVENWRNLQFSFLKLSGF